MIAAESWTRKGYRLRHVGALSFQIEADAGAVLPQGLLRGTFAVSQLAMALPCTRPQVVAHLLALLAVYDDAELTAQVEGFVETVFAALPDAPPPAAPTPVPPASVPPSVN